MMRHSELQSWNERLFSHILAPILCICQLLLRKFAHLSHITIILSHITMTRQIFNQINEFLCDKVYLFVTCLDRTIDFNAVSIF
jgi:hypothetical protein